MNRVVVISGGSSGIGKELVKLFCKQNDLVISLSRSNPCDYERHIFCDVTDKSSIDSAVDKIQKNYGRIDILINNAGYGISGATELLPYDEVKAVVDADYLGALFLSSAALKIMPHSGKIINISSACALFALPFRGVYCSAKAAMNMMSFSMRMELDSFGIKVICVCPGDVKTEFTKNRRKFSYTNEKYGSSPVNSALAIDNKQSSRMDVAKTAQKIFHIADKKSKPLYIIGAKYKFFYLCQKLLPTNLFLLIIKKLFVK